MMAPTIIKLFRLLSEIFEKMEARQTGKCRRAAAGKFKTVQALLLMPVRWEVPATGSTESAFSSDTYVWGDSPFIIALVHIAVFSKSHSLPSGYFQNIFAPNLVSRETADSVRRGTWEDTATNTHFAWLTDIRTESEVDEVQGASVLESHPDFPLPVTRSRGRGQSVNE